MCYSFEYVNTQPHNFRKIYIDSFMDDNMGAYKNKNDKLSCVGGMIERSITSLIFACKSDENNKDYEEILIALNIKNILIDLIIDWYKLHNNSKDNRFTPGTPIDIKKKDLEDFLLSKYPNNKKEIDEVIISNADPVGYDDEVFIYGGRRKTYKRQKINKRRKTSKQRK